MSGARRYRVKLPAAEAIVLRDRVRARYRGCCMCKVTLPSNVLEPLVVVVPQNDGARPRVVAVALCPGCQRLLGDPEAVEAVQAIARLRDAGLMAAAGEATPGH